MRTHSTIVKAAGIDKLASLRGVSIHTARSWEQRDSIPAGHWAGIARAKIATLNELSDAAELNLMSAKPRSTKREGAVA